MTTEVPQSRVVRRCVVTVTSLVVPRRLQRSDGRTVPQHAVHLLPAGRRRPVQPATEHCRTRYAEHLVALHSVALQPINWLDEDDRMN